MSFSKKFFWQLSSVFLMILCVKSFCFCSDKVLSSSLEGDTSVDEVEDGGTFLVGVDGLGDINMDKIRQLHDVTRKNLDEMVDARDRLSRWADLFENKKKRLDTTKSSFVWLENKLDEIFSCAKGSEGITDDILVYMSGGLPEKVKKAIVYKIFLEQEKKMRDRNYWHFSKFKTRLLVACIGVSALITVLAGKLGLFGRDIDGDSLADMITTIREGGVIDD